MVEDLKPTGKFEIKVISYLSPESPAMVYSYYVRNTDLEDLWLCVGSLPPQARDGFEEAMYKALVVKEDEEELTKLSAIVGVGWEKIEEDPVSINNLHRIATEFVEGGVESMKAIMEHSVEELLEKKGDGLEQLIEDLQESGDPRFTRKQTYLN